MIGDFVFVVVALRFAFAVPLFVVVLGSFEYRMLLVVLPSRVPYDVWLYLLLKPPEAHLPLIIFKRRYKVNILSGRDREFGPINLAIDLSY